MANMAPQAGEPTMEEILASIRRIISEEESEAVPVASSESENLPEPEPEEDVLELTEIVDAEPAFEPEPQPEPEPVYTRPALAEPQTDIAFEPVEEELDAEPEGLLADKVAEQATAAFARLHRDIPITHSAMNVSLEAVVRELLKPLLKQWLDANLTDIVERIVREEVERVANRRR